MPIAQDMHSLTLIAVFEFLAKNLHENIWSRRTPSKQFNCKFELPQYHQIMKSIVASSSVTVSPTRTALQMKLNHSSFAPRMNVVRLQSLALRPSRSTGLVVAYKETEKIQDWRVQQMVEKAHIYFSDFLTKGNESVAEDILDDSIVHKDMVWDPAHPTVGVQGMKHYVHDLKAAFPDFWVNIEQISTCDTNCIWVKYEGAATGLGEYHGHKATHHTSPFSGINVLKFNADRSKIVEIEGKTTLR